MLRSSRLPRASHLLAVTLLCCSACAVTNDRTRAAPAGEVICLTGASVITMASPGLLPDHTVWIENGVITRVTPADGAPVPAGARAIDARGCYLLPGLMDMHVHLSDERDPPKLLSYGVTTVRHMSDLPWWPKLLMGFPDGLSLRRRVAAGRLPGPTIWCAGMTLDGQPPVSPMNKVIRTPAEVRAEIARQAAQGVDLVKVYDRLSPAVYEAVLREAQARGLPVAGHVPFSVGLEAALRSSLVSIEHLTGYVDQHRAVLLVDEDSLASVAAQTRAAGKVNCPTLVIWRNIPARDRYKELQEQPEYALLSWRLRWLWHTTLGYLEKKPYRGTDLAGDMTRLTVQVTRALHQAGCTLVAGTDMNFLGVYPGISLHQELECLVDAGLSSAEALHAATVAPAELLGLGESLGSIAVGKQADLVLLTANPLEDIRNTCRIRGVMKAGRWYEGEALAALRR